MDFSPFDNRGYPTLPVREGYSAWADTYDDTVLCLMDLRLAEALVSVRWSEHRAALDLACGTGRFGAWLRTRGVDAVDGVDLTPAMLARAQARGAYRALITGEVTAVDRPDGSYSLICQSLADEHLPELGPLYAEGFRLTAPGGQFVLIGYHPWFLMWACRPTSATLRAATSPSTATCTCSPTTRRRRSRPAGGSRSCARR